MQSGVIWAPNLNHKNGNKTNNNEVRTWYRNQWSSGYNLRHPCLNQQTNTKQTKRKEMGSIKKKKQSKQGTHLRLTCSQLSFPVLFPSPALPSRPHCNPPPCGSRCYLFLLDPFLAYLAMEYPLTRMLSATLCSGSPRLKKNPRYLLFFSSVCVFLSKPSSAPLLL